MLKDDSTLRDIKLTKGAKMMVIGSTIQDVLTIAPPLPESTKPSVSSASNDYIIVFVYWFVWDKDQYMLVSLVNICLLTMYK